MKIYLHATYSRQLRPQSALQQAVDARFQDALAKQQNPKHQPNSLRDLEVQLSLSQLAAPSLLAAMVEHSAPKRLQVLNQPPSPRLSPEQTFCSAGVASAVWHAILFLFLQPLPNQHGVMVSSKGVAAFACCPRGSMAFCVGECLNFGLGASKQWQVQNLHKVLVLRSAKTGVVVRPLLGCHLSDVAASSLVAQMEVQMHFVGA